MSEKLGRNIALVGASGSLGSQTVEALLAYSIHTITVISRAGSTATFPSGVNVRRGPYDEEEFLLTALKGQDVLILQVGFMGLDSQIPLINAAAKAGVPWVIPCEFASDNKHEKLNQEINMMNMKKKYRDRIEQLDVSSWIGIVNNPWFDWSFKKGYWGIDVKERKARLFDDGAVKINTTTLPKVGQSLAALVSLADSKLARFKNEFVYFSSFHVSQREILDSVIHATGTHDSDWVIESEPAAEAAEAAKDAIRKGNGMKNVDLLFATLFRDGYGGDYEAKGTVNEMLGLEQENFDDVVKELVREVEVSE